MRKYLKVEEAAVRLDCTAKTVYNYRDRGLLKQEMVGTRKRFVSEQVERLREQLIESGQIQEEVAA